MISNPIELRACISVLLDIETQIMTLGQYQFRPDAKEKAEEHRRRAEIITKAIDNYLNQFQ